MANSQVAAHVVKKHFCVRVIEAAECAHLVYRAETTNERLEYTPERSDVDLRLDIGSYEAVVPLVAFSNRAVPSGWMTIVAQYFQSKTSCRI